MKDQTAPDVKAPPGSSKERIPSLDGLRGISISLVLLGHLSGTRGFTTVDLGIGDYARLGVIVFFVISGFLITGLLVSEEMRKGQISLKRFYARRCLRLFPACYFYIAVIAALGVAGVFRITGTDVLSASTYTVNFMHSSTAKQLSHLWSLSVEEQFYLLWPLALVTWGSRRASVVAGLVILIGPLARLANRFLLGEYQNLDMFPMVADSIAMGCLLSRERAWLETQSWYQRLLRPLPSAAIVAFTLLMNRFAGDYTIATVFGTSLINLGIAFLVHRAVLFPWDRAGQVLNSRPLAAVGVLSYSLYLWQQMFINRDGQYWINAFPQNLILAALAGIGSYFLLEKPLLRLRQRLA